MLGLDGLVFLGGLVVILIPKILRYSFIQAQCR